jgi:hypothetical protein
MLKNFGSISKNVKRLTVITALLFSSQMIDPASCEDSKYSMRIHKNFIKNILDKNFNVILSHIENKVEKNVFLQEI